MTYIIFSIDNIHDTHTLAKFLRHMDSKFALGYTRSKLTPCVGLYQGVLEYSFVCHEDDYCQFVVPYGATQNQESILAVEGSKMSTFLITNDSESS